MFTIQQLIDAERATGVNFTKPLFFLEFTPEQLIQIHRIWSGEEGNKQSFEKCLDELLDSLGIGDSYGVSNTPNDDAEESTKTLEEVILPLVYFAIGNLGMNNAFDLQAKTVIRSVDSYYDHLKYLQSLDEISVFNAVGRFKQKKFKPIKPFEEKKKAGLGKKISDEERQATLDMIGGGN